MKYENRYFSYDRPVSVGPKQGFHPGTQLRQIPIHFVLTDAGLGDYINASAAFLWAAQHLPWIEGHLYCVEYLVPFFSRILAPYKHWRVINGDSGFTINSKYLVVAPDFQENKGKPLLNPLTSHLIDLAFAMYLGINPAPPEAKLPLLKLDDVVTPELPAHYAVFPLGNITPSRKTSGKHWNPVIQHAIKLGLTPVFLGKEEHSIGVKFPDDIDYDCGINLINKTNILEAAKIMDGAQVVLGLDSGLLHLAACTDAKLVFGYNIASPKHRQPRRSSLSTTIDVTLTSEELPCIHCQSNIPLLINHDFHYCIWKDDKKRNLRCLDLLFANEGQKWKDAIDYFNWTRSENARKVETPIQENAGTP